METSESDSGSELRPTMFELLTSGISGVYVNILESVYNSCLAVLFFQSNFVFFISFTMDTVAATAGGASQKVYSAFT
jgi:hypothetical protein